MFVVKRGLGKISKSCRRVCVSSAFPPQLYHTKDANTSDGFWIWILGYSVELLESAKLTILKTDYSVYERCRIRVCNVVPTGCNVSILRSTFSLLCLAVENSNHLISYMCSFYLCLFSKSSPYLFLAEMLPSICKFQYSKPCFKNRHLNFFCPKSPNYYVFFE